jgi:aldehyde:ferredoxin oxidoreductase
MLLHPIQTPDGEQSLTDYYRKKSFTREDLERLLDSYYEDRGWDIKSGIPTTEKFRALGLGEFIKDLP